MQLEVACFQRCRLVPDIKEYGRGLITGIMEYGRGLITGIGEYGCGYG